MFAKLFLDVEEAYLSRKIVLGGLLAGALGIAFGLSRHILPIIYPRMEAPLELNLGQLGLITSSHFLFYTVTAFFSGHLSDRVEAKPIIAGACLLCSAGTLGIGFSKGFISLLAISSITGIGAGGLFVPMVAWVLKRFKEKKGAMISMILVGEGALGIAIGLAIPLIIFSFGWRHVWWLFGFVLLAISIVLWISINDTRVHASPLPLNNVRWLMTFSHVLGLPKIRNLGFVYFLHGLTRGAFVTFSVTYVVGQGMTYSSASKAFSFLAMGFIPGAIFSGILADRYNPKYILIGLLSIEICSIGLLLLDTDFLLIYTVFGFVGFCLTGIPTVMNVFPPQFIAEKEYGSTVGTLSLMYNFGAAVSPFIGVSMGVLNDSLTFAILFGLFSAFGAISITFLKI